MEIKVKSYTEHVQSPGLSSIVQLRNILTHKMAVRKGRKWGNKMVGHAGYHPVKFQIERQKHLRVIESGNGISRWRALPPCFKSIGGF